MNMRSSTVAAARNRSAGADADPEELPAGAPAGAVAPDRREAARLSLARNWAWSVLTCCCRRLTVSP